MKNTSTAWKKDNERMKRNREVCAQQTERFGVLPQKLTTKRKATDDILSAGKAAKVQHAEASNSCVSQKEPPRPQIVSQKDQPSQKIGKTVPHSQPKSKQSALSIFFKPV